MEQVIAKLLEDFELGKMSRRQLIQTLAVAAVGSAAPPALAAEGYKMNAVNINHISFGVADYARTRDFYVDLLNMKVSNDDGKQCYLHFGESILLARKTRQPDNKPFVDHICYTLHPWDDKAVEAELNRRGLKPREDLGGHTRSFHVKDPDGFDVQLQGPLPT
jgi:catechol 2,3-dioxygenase-like lactoylglutathione lyase family enzyme